MSILQSVWVNVALLRPVELWHPVLGIVVYLGINQLLSGLSLDLGRCAWVKGLVVAHNCLLAVYSGWTFCTAISLLTLEDLFDVNGEAVFAAPGVAGLIHLFYLSKYYEFFDTWIHYMKGRSPGFLQVYHHVGAVLIMALLVKFKVELAWFWLIFNSGVHTVMYSYYAGATVGLRFPFKPLITMLQMTQFVVGLSVSAWNFTYQRMTREQTAIVALNNLYVIVLLGLFLRFYDQQYRTKGGGKQS